MNAHTPPYLGAAYYPEAWPDQEMDRDIEWMKRAGMNVMRLGEFAWGRMEGREGTFDFDWLHQAVERLAAAGIATVLGTPTCTPPAWLSQRYPEILAVGADGRACQHGARRHACPNSPVFREHCRRIVTRMAREFGRDSNVIGWQIDNEVYPKGPRGCCCPVCLAAFRQAMRERFGDIAALNAAWGLDLWSMAYCDFDQLPSPRMDTWHHPSLLTAWMRFQSDSQVRFVAFQTEILRDFTAAPISTDMMYFNGVDYHDMFASLDLVQHNNYHQVDNLWHEAFWADFCRPLKDRPFWISETATCWNGATFAERYKQEGFCRANTWLPIALGAEMNLYWPWRTHWAGQELCHSAMLSSAGRPYHVFEEVRQIAEGLGKAGEFLCGTRPAGSGLAVHFSGLAWWMFEFQPMVKDFKYLPRLLEDFYGPMIRSQLRPDVIAPAADVESYRLICSPYLPSLEEAGVGPRMLEWVERGGTWIVGPFSDVRTAEATKYRHAPLGCLEDWAGAFVRYSLPGDPRSFALRWADGVESGGSVWFDALEPRGSEAMATYTEGPLAGLAAVTQRQVGKGRIVLLGTVPVAGDFQRLLLGLAAAAGIAPVAEASANLMVVPRRGRAGEGVIAVELANQPAQLTLPRPARDLLTGLGHSGQVQVKPYGVMVLAF